MRDVLHGFLTIWVVIGAGMLLAHLRVLDDHAREVLARVSFTIGTPALLFVMLSTADVARVFAGNLLVTVLATGVAALLYVVLARLLVRPGRSELVMGAMTASYVNSANLGLPIAAYVLKDVTWVAPLLLFQVALLQPICLTILDHDATTTGDGARLRRPWWFNVVLPFRNPMTLGSLAGLAVNLAGWSIPGVLRPPLELLGDLSIPTMLIAFGISLRLGPLPGRGGVLTETALATTIKLVVHPLVAWLLARLLHLDATTTLAVVVMAGLPTAQNVFLWASRYRRGLVLVRDVIFITTTASVVSIAILGALLRG